MGQDTQQTRDTTVSNSEVEPWNDNSRFERLSRYNKAIDEAYEGLNDILKLAYNGKQATMIKPAYLAYLQYRRAPSDEGALRFLATIIPMIGGYVHMGQDRDDIVLSLVAEIYKDIKGILRRTYLSPRLMRKYLTLVIHNKWKGVTRYMYRCRNGVLEYGLTTEFNGWTNKDSISEVHLKDICETMPERVIRRCRLPYKYRSFVKAYAESIVTGRPPDFSGCGEINLRTLKFIYNYTLVMVRWLLNEPRKQHMKFAPTPNIDRVYTS